MGLWFFLFFLSAVHFPMAWGEDDNHGVLASGVIHNIAPDRRVEKIGGIMQPEPLDLYMKRLFEGLSKKLDQMDQRLVNIENSVLRGAPQTPVSSAQKTKSTSN